MNKAYKILSNQIFSHNEYSIVPIRYEDRIDIMNWRNQQIYHLRQNRPLTIQDQNNYFDNVVNKLFDEEKPNQILFSYLENEKCVGYGGLVHINWTDKNAEISFVIDTALEEQFFEKHWSIYLKLIEKVAFLELNLHKIYTYAYDMRPRLFRAIEGVGYLKEAVLKEHCLINGEFLNVLIHSKKNIQLLFSKITPDDEKKTFQWASDSTIRKHSFNTQTITREEHNNWFRNKLKSTDCYYYIAKSTSGKSIGSIRFDVINNSATISYLLDPEFHGMGYGKQLLRQGIAKFITDKSVNSIEGRVIKQNIPSVKAFRDLGFSEEEIDENTLKFLKKMK